MTQVSWRKLKSWSGCKISGKKEYTLVGNDTKDHMKRVLWLTAQVEGGGLFGSVQSYDGCGMSAGLEHCIGLYPKTMTQGSLWKLLREIELYGSCNELNILWDAFKTGPKWYVDPKGVLRRWNTGQIIPAQEIRNVLSPPGGKVPNGGKDWEEAKRWAMLFHNLFSAENTFKVQINSGITNLINGNKRDEAEGYKKSTGVEEPSLLEVGKNLSMEMDLAWAIYHSFSVNAPAIARQVLKSSNPDDSKDFPSRLIRLLGKKQYGNWTDTKGNGSNRYDRTRIFAMRSGLWPQELFVGPTAIMPIDL